MGKRDEGRAQARSKVKLLCYVFPSATVRALFYTCEVCSGIDVLWSAIIQSWRRPVAMTMSRSLKQRHKKKNYFVTTLLLYGNNVWKYKRTFKAFCLYSANNNCQNFLYIKMFSFNLIHFLVLSKMFIVQRIKIY